MSLAAPQFRTGLLTLLSLGLLAAALVWLAAPGVIRPQVRHQVYFADAGGIQPGAAVLLGGRQIGRVRMLYSPVPEQERPLPGLAARVEVEVSREAQIYNATRPRMLQYGLLGDQVIDFSAGAEASGLAAPGTGFVGERQPGLNEVTPKLLEQLEPVLQRATAALAQVEKAGANLAAFTDQGADLMELIGSLRDTAENLAELSAIDGSLQKTLGQLETMTGKDGPLLRMLENGEKFTARLAGNADLDAALGNLRRSTGELDRVLRTVTPGLEETSRSAAQFTDTIKRQPWRLIWPTTKRYPDDTPKPRRALWATPKPPATAGR